MSQVPPPRRGGTPLSERTAVSGGAPATDPWTSLPADRARHCWVLGVGPDRVPGLLAEWQRTPSGRWRARVVFASRGPFGLQLVEAWVPGEQLVPVG